MLSDQHGQFALHLLPTDGTPGRLLKNVFHPCWDVTWSPDGKWIASKLESTASDRRIYVIPVKSTQGDEESQTFRLKIKGELLNAQHLRGHLIQNSWRSRQRTVNGMTLACINVETGKSHGSIESMVMIHNHAGRGAENRIGWVHAEGRSDQLAA